MPTAITTSTRNWLASSAALVGLIAAVTACEEPREIGFPPTTPVGVFYSDSIVPTRSTVLLDSVRTSLNSTLLVGRYVDPLFGTVRATAYTQLNLQSTVSGTTVQVNQFIPRDSAGVDIPQSEIVYDSTLLYLAHTGFIYGDTLQTQEIAVHRLTEDIAPDRTYTINNSVAYDPQPLGRLQTRIRPTATIGDRIRLSDAFGQELLAMGYSNVGKDNALFRAQLKGIALVAGRADRAAVVGFNAIATDANRSAIAVFYHRRGRTTSQRYEFLIDPNTGHFNQVVADRAGTPLAGLRPQQPVSATALRGQAYLQPSTGVGVRLEFPGLTDLLSRGRAAVNRADLVITPRRPESSLYPLPPYLALAEINEQQQVPRTLRYQALQLVPTATQLFDRTPEAFSVSPQVAIYNSRTNAYTFSLGGYLQSVAAGTTPNNGVVLLTPSSTTIPRIANGALVNAQAHFVNDRIWRAVLEGDASVRLIIFYTTSN